MKNLVRCKACGFLMEEGEFHECPACGVPEKMFEAYEDKVPADRRKVLKLHLHPVIVHAPQALAFVMLILVAFRLLSNLTGWFSDTDQGLVYPGLELLAILLPVTTLGGILSGLLDGKYRYKKLNTILLKRKMLVGSLFLVFSIGMAIVAFLPSFKSDTWGEITFLVLNIAAFGCSVLLGLWGAALNLAEMPGPWAKKKAPKPESS